MLVVEDDRTIALAIEERLLAEGFDVTTCADGLIALDVAGRVEPDIVVLDLMLPGLDGTEVCRRLQAARPTPVLMLTARSDESDMLVGLGLGADDYMTKPFSQKELVARIRSILRRVDRTKDAVRGDGQLTVVTSGGLSLDRRRRIVTFAGRIVDLTATEFDLLANLYGHAGAVRTRLQLLDEVWGYRDGSGDRTVDSHVRSVRRKIADDVIRTVHGVGYASRPVPESR